MVVLHACSQTLQDELKWKRCAFHTTECWVLMYCKKLNYYTTAMYTLQEQFVIWTVERQCPFLRCRRKPIIWDNSLAQLNYDRQWTRGQKGLVIIMATLLNKIMEFERCRLTHFINSFCTRLKILNVYKNFCCLRQFCTTQWFCPPETSCRMPYAPQCCQALVHCQSISQCSGYGISNFISSKTVEGYTCKIRGIEHLTL